MNDLDTCHRFDLACGNIPLWEEVEREVDDFCICTRGFIPHQDALFLVAICIAYPKENSVDGPFYYSVVGGTGHGKYKPGATFDIAGCRITSRTPIEEVVAAKKKAVDRLIQDLRNQ